PASQPQHQAAGGRDRESNRAEGSSAAGLIGLCDGTSGKAGACSSRPVAPITHPAHPDNTRLTLHPAPIRADSLSLEQSGREPMLRLTRHEPYDDSPESYPFPTEAARLLRRKRFGRAPVDRAASAAAGRVERAMRDVQLRFRNLRELMGYPDQDPDRPRAA